MFVEKTACFWHFCFSLFTFSFLLKHILTSILNTTLRSCNEDKELAISLIISLCYTIEFLFYNIGKFSCLQLVLFYFNIFLFNHLLLHSLLMTNIYLLYSPLQKADTFMFFYLVTNMDSFGPPEKSYFTWTFSETIWYLAK